jgi:hypothetical protein
VWAMTSACWVVSDRLSMTLSMHNPYRGGQPAAIPRGGAFKAGACGDASPSSGRYEDASMTPQWTPPDAEVVSLKQAAVRSDRVRRWLGLS